MKISPKDKRVLAFVTEHLSIQKQSPTLEEITRLLGFKSITSIQRSLKKLEEAGLISRSKHAHRSIEVTSDNTNTVSIPLVGVVACGAPILAQENIEEYIPTDTALIRGNQGEYFYLRASGDSMNNRGIEDGDLMLIESQETAREGELVVALIDDSATVKIFRRSNDCIVLEPDSKNPKHKPIILREDFLIQGRVVKVIGKY